MVAEKNRNTATERPIGDAAATRWFALPSLVGVGLFLTPISIGGKQTIVIGWLVDQIVSLTTPISPYLLLLAMFASALGGAYFVWKRPSDWATSRPILHAICHATPLWMVLRVLGLSLGAMVVVGIGPDTLRGAETGQVIYFDILIPVLYILAISCLLMPFLTDYGLMEFVGTILQRPFALLFRLPGRAAVDAAASMAAASSVGLLITIRQYEKGIYTAREAASIAMNFSIVSIPFCLVVAQTIGFSEQFFAWYLSVILCCLVCACVMVRLPPLRSISDSSFPTQDHVQQVSDEHHVKRQGGLLANAVQAAKIRAATAPGPTQFVTSGMRSAIDVICGVIAPCMFVATATIALSIHTDVFATLSYPLYLLIDGFGVPQADKAAPGLVVGFFDMFMPALIAQPLADPTTRFVLGGLAVTQLVYMSDVGMIVLRSSIPLNLTHLIAVFVLRTIIAVPVLLLCAKLVI